MNAAKPGTLPSADGAPDGPVVEESGRLDNAQAAQRNLNSRLRQSGIWIVFWRVVGTLLGLVTNVAVSHLLSPAAFGGFVVALNVINGGGIIARFGADRTILKLAGRSFAVGQRNEGFRAIRLGLILATVSSVVVGSLIFSPLHRS
ncbi:MAG: hypothetical protein U0936_24465 [Planctomycetaceae bacterium]